MPRAWIGSRTCELLAVDTAQHSFDAFAALDVAQATDGEDSLGVERGSDTSTS